MYASPIRYYSLVLGSTAALWLLAAALGSGPLGLSLLLLGLLAPALIAYAAVRRLPNQDARREHWLRLVEWRRLRLGEFAVQCLFMPTSVLLAVVLSIPWGGSWEQLRFAEGFSFAVGSLPTLLVLLLAAVFEELGWRGYAFSLLQQRCSLRTSVLVFGMIWSLWHVPLLAVPGSYQQGLWEVSPLYALNFFVSIVPLGVIISWVCLRQKGSVLAAMLFHFVVNVSQEALDLTQSTKCLQTMLLSLLALVVWRSLGRSQPPHDRGLQAKGVWHTPPRHTWRSAVVRLTLGLVLLAQGLGLYRRAQVWHQGLVPSELLSSTLALQGAWCALLLWAWRKPAVRPLALVLSALAMLLGNGMHSLSQVLASRWGGTQALGNSCLDLTVVAGVLCAAWWARSGVRRPCHLLTPLAVGMVPSATTASGISEGVPMRTVKDPEVRRQEIVDAAQQLFLQQTYEQTTTNDVMRALSIAKGTIYHYFPSKDHLLEAVVDQMAQAYVARRQPAVAACAGDAVARIRVLFDREAISAEERSATANLHQPGNVILHTRLLVGLVQRMAPVLADVIREGCAQGLFATEHPLEVAELLLSGIQFLTDEGVYPWSSEARTRRLQAVPAMVERQLQAKPGTFAFLNPLAV